MGDLTTRLATFVHSALDRAWDGCDLEGGEIQDLAERLGLIVQVKYDPQIHGENDVGAVAGDSWFERADDFKALRP